MSIEGERTISNRAFVLFCFGGFLLSIAYGFTFLIPLLVQSRGGDEGHAGLIISVASITTVSLVIVSGHVSDFLGAGRSIALSSIFLAISALGFALSTDLSFWLLLSALSLGIGWGIFYTLGPIVVASVTSGRFRMRSFALLSGAMMCGFAAGPILGRGAELFDLATEQAFLVAAAASALGGLIFLILNPRLISGGAESQSVSRLSKSAFVKVMSSQAKHPIIMVGLLGCIFGGFSSFQTSYAAQQGLDYSVFFITFMSVVIFSRLILSHYIATREPYGAALFFAVLVALSFVGYIHVDGNLVIYILSSVVLGVGYGLCHSVINGIAASEAPEGLTAQTLLIYSLSYLFCVFAFPLAAGRLIADSGVDVMLWAILFLSVLCSLIAFLRFVRIRRFAQETIS